MFWTTPILKFPASLTEAQTEAFAEIKEVETPSNTRLFLENQITSQTVATATFHKEAICELGFRDIAQAKKLEKQSLVKALNPNLHITSNQRNFAKGQVQNKWSRDSLLAKQNLQQLAN